VVATGQELVVFEKEVQTIGNGRAVVLRSKPSDPPQLGIIDHAPAEDPDRIALCDRACREEAEPLDPATAARPPAGRASIAREPGSLGGSSAMRIRPSNPVGRSSRTSAMIAKMSASANCGKSTFAERVSGSDERTARDGARQRSRPPTTTTTSE